jgi:hypothetical protein
MTPLAVNAAFVKATFFVDFNRIVDDAAVNLPDGSIIQIVASTDGTAGFFQEYTPGVYLANTTTGNDTIIAEARIGDLGYEGTGGGRFGWVDTTFDTTANPYVYIRFFNTNSFDALLGTPTELVWGTSAVVFVDDFVDGLGVADINFASNGNLVANQTNTFQVIPEPGTTSLMAMAGSILLAMQASMARRSRRERRDKLKA